MNTDSKKTIPQKIEGIVVSAKMQKTVAVRVDRKKPHAKYGKYFTISKKYLAHDEKGEYQEGDRVTIVACRPLSRRKSWKVMPKETVTDTAGHVSTI